MSDVPDLDAVLERFKEGGKAEATDLDKLLAIKKLELDAAERRLAQEKEDRRTEREEARRAETMKMIIGLGSTLLPALLNKPTMDPALLAMLSNRNGADEFKNMMEMQRQQAAQSMESLKTALLGIMSTKDEMHKRLLEDALERAEDGGGESSGGFAGTLRELRLSLGALGGAGILAGAASAPAPAPALPAPSANGENPPPRPAPRAPAHPVVTVMRQLKLFQEGKVTKPALARAALVTVVLQDDELARLITAGDGNELFSYCAPHVGQHADLMQWIQIPGVAEWLELFIGDRLAPLVEEAMDDGEGDDGEDETVDDAEPEMIGPATVTPPRAVPPLKAAPIPNVATVAPAKPSGSV
jgi:hypothetical protein